jgi:hypothetical protein
VFVRRESSELNEAAGRFDDTVFPIIVPENLLLSDLDLWSKVIKEDAMKRGHSILLRNQDFSII